MHAYFYYIRSFNLIKAPYKRLKDELQISQFVVLDLCNFSLSGLDERFSALLNKFLIFLIIRNKKLII